MEIRSSGGWTAAAGGAPPALQSAPGAETGSTDLAPEELARLTIRTASIGDMRQVEALIRDFAARNLMLPKSYDQKVWADCRDCPKLHACDEVAVARAV